jgi:solute carrier family 13 (sodium-dependent dicarboxylate transporter), member 2/3/5
MTAEHAAPTSVDRGRRRVGWAGLLGAPPLGVLVYASVPDTVAGEAGQLIELGHAGRATAGLAVVMAIWWMTEAIEIPATALLPIAVLPLLGAASATEAAAPYANPLIFLFLGGFLLALAMRRWGLERRIALIALRLVGTEPRRVVGGFMVLTAVLSMWVSNTATVAMMLPIALSIIDASVPAGREALLRGGDEPGRDFARSLLFGIAVSASIGGVGTLIGTPPNLFLASFARESLSVDISFAQWLAFGVPVVAVFLPLAWVLLTWVLFPPDLEPGALEGALAGDGEDLGPVSRGEWATFVVFCLAASAWVLRPLLEDVTVLGGAPFAGLTDAGIAVIAGVALFVIPVDVAEREFVLDWDTAAQLPWGILVLFGGGLSLAAAIEANAVAEYLGAQATVLDGLPPVVLVAVIAAGVVFLTELTSNTATAAALVPILAAVAPGLDLHPLALAIPAAVAASLAFMLPVATPPNAIVFGSGLLTIPEMMRVGLRLNVAAVVIITVATYALAAPVFGFDLSLW